MRLGIIGATGWLGTALGRRLLAAGTVLPEDLVALNRSGPRPEHFGAPQVVWARDAADLVAQSEIVVVSVRPEDWPALYLRAPDRLVISFMAGIGLEALAACGGRIVRAMPNGAAEIGASYTPWLAGPGGTAQDRATVTALLSAIGASDEVVSEAHLDALSAVSGSGAAYPALMALALREFLTAHGLPEAIAWRAAESVVCEGAALLSGQIAQEAPRLLDLYHGYRGVTAAGLDAAEAAGFGRSLAAALEAALSKSDEMAGKGRR